MKLGSKLSSKNFVLSMMTILIGGLVFLTGLYYILNIQNQRSQNLFSNGPVTTLPKTLRLDLNQPTDDSLIFQSSTIVSGQTTPGVNILISTETQDLIVEPKTDGSFSTVLALDEGVNTISIIVFDPTGDSKSTKRTVYYSKEKI